MLVIVPPTKFWENSDIRNEVKLWVRWLESLKKKTFKYDEQKSPILAVNRNSKGCDLEKSNNKE